MRKNGVWVCFIGIDGSGKTSHALALCKELSRKNINYAYVRSRYALLRYIPSILKRRINENGALSPRRMTISSGNRKASSSKGILKGPLTVMLFAYAFLTYLLCIKPLLRNSIVVCDRYFFDLFYNLWGTSSYALIGVLPGPDVAFVFDLPVTVAFSRMHSADDKNIPQEYYGHLRAWYLSLAKERGFTVIDSSSDFKRTKQLVLDRMRVFLKGCDDVA
jgi:thymidylate kinase